MQVPLIAVLALAGCNQVYSLDQTQLRDGASPDAPYACTAAAPVFRGNPVPVVTGGEYSRTYSISLDRRIAVANRIGGIVEGPGDAPLTDSALLMPPPPGTILSPRLSPEGDELFVAYSTGVMPTIHRYAREGGIWVEQALILTLTANLPELSIPTRKELGPRRMVVGTNTVELREYVETAGQWTQVGAVYTAADLGAGTIDEPNLSSDGLRLVFHGQYANDNTLLYASRTSVNERFGKVVAANPFFGNPRVYDPYLLDDCSRLYFFVVANPQGVFYVEPD